MMKIVVADIGGTHARFALAELSETDRPKIGPMHRYRTREHSDLRSAWAAFSRDAGETLPDQAAIAVAAPIEGEELRFMNSHWRLSRFGLAEELLLERMTLLNDFGAVANAVSVLEGDELLPVWGPNSLPKNNIITVIGPGTGLGVAILDRRGGEVRVIETEAAHIGYSPIDSQEQALAQSLAGTYERASVERVVSGPGLIDIYRHLGGAGDYDANLAGELWTAAIEGTNRLAAEALDIFVRSFGAAAGDISLAHGAMGVVISGGLANRIVDRLRSPAFSDRFVAKGRYRARMHRVSVMLVTYEEPGLLGSAVAFQREHFGRPSV